MHLEGWSKFLLVLGTCIALAGALVSFHKHCERRFQYPIFSIRLMTKLAAGVLLLAAGGWVFSKHVDAWDVPGTLLFIAGGIIVWWNLSQNFIRTSLLHGAVATLLQLGLICVFGPVVALIGLSIGGMAIVLFSLIVPVFVLNRRGQQ